MISKAVALVTSLAATAIAQTTLNLFVDGDSDERFVGSVVSANCDETTFAFRCTAGDYGSGSLSATCDPSATIFATYGPNSYEISTEATQDGTAVTLLETCSLTSNTEAVCSFSVGVSMGGQRTATASTTTLTKINHYQIPITAGASKLPSTVSCTNSPNAAAPTGITDVYKVLVVPAAILAGALA